MEYSGRNSRRASSNIRKEHKARSPGFFCLKYLDWTEKIGGGGRDAMMSDFPSTNMSMSRITTFNLSTNTNSMYDNNSTINNNIPPDRLSLMLIADQHSNNNTDNTNSYRNYQCNSVGNKCRIGSEDDDIIGNDDFTININSHTNNNDVDVNDLDSKVDKRTIKNVRKMSPHKFCARPTSQASVLPSIAELNFANDIIRVCSNDDKNNSSNRDHLLLTSSSTSTENKYFIRNNKSCNKSIEANIIRGLDEKNWKRGLIKDAIIDYNGQRNNRRIPYQDVGLSRMQNCDIASRGTKLKTIDNISSKYDDVLIRSNNVAALAVVVDHQQQESPRLLSPPLASLPLNCGLPSDQLDSCHMCHNNGNCVCNALDSNYQAVPFRGQSIITRTTTPPIYVNNDEQLHSENDANLGIVVAQDNNCESEKESIILSTSCTSSHSSCSFTTYQTDYDGSCSTGSICSASTSCSLSASCLSLCQTDDNSNINEIKMSKVQSVRSNVSSDNDSSRNSTTSDRLDTAWETRL